MKNLWYISKYFEYPGIEAGACRGFFLLREMQKKGVNVTAFISDANHLIRTPSFEGKILEEDVQGVRIVWIKTFKHQAAKSLGRILSWLSFEWNLFFLKKSRYPRPDAVIVSSLSLLSIINGIFLKSKYKCRLIFEIRDIWPLTVVEEGGFSPKNPFVKMLGLVERIGYRKSDLIVGTMPRLDIHVNEVLQIAKPVRCIPMGIEKDYFYSNQSEIDADYLEKYIPKDKFVVMYAGTIGIANALETFFEVAERLKDHTEIHFVLLGEGGLRQTFMEKYGSMLNVTFAPRVKKNYVQSILKHADLLYFSTFPSKVWEYGQSLNKVIDYMMAGKPIIANYDGYPSMINEAGCGYFISNGKPELLIERIIELSQMDPKERDLVGEKGREWLLKNRPYDKLAGEYLDMIFGENIG